MRYKKIGVVTSVMLRNAPLCSVMHYGTVPKKKECQLRNALRNVQNKEFNLRNALRR